MTAPTLARAAIHPDLYPYVDSWDLGGYVTGSPRIGNARSYWPTRAEAINAAYVGLTALRVPMAVGTDDGDRWYHQPQAAVLAAAAARRGVTGDQWRFYREGWAGYYDRVGDTPDGTAHARCVSREHAFSAARHAARVTGTKMRVYYHHGVTQSYWAYRPAAVRPRPCVGAPLKGLAPTTTLWCDHAPPRDDAPDSAVAPAARRCHWSSSGQTYSPAALAMAYHDAFQHHRHTGHFVAAIHPARPR